MSFKIASAALILALAAGTAGAETVLDSNPGFVTRGDATATISVNGGSDMLAKLARVTPGEYTNNEMLRIQEARQDGDAQLLAYYLNHDNREGASSANNLAAKAQVAGPLGLNPADYTMAELIVLNAQNNDRD